MNIIEKILLSHSVEEKKDIGPKDTLRVSIDRAIMLDMAGMHPEFLKNPPKQVFDPKKISIIFDHFVPAPSIEVADGTRKIRKLAEHWGVEDFYDYGRGGISHAFAAENGWILPGMIIANTDSHTISVGAYNAIGRGVGMPELMQILCTGETWFIVGDTIKVFLSGRLEQGVEAKDIFLWMASAIGETSEMNIEFGGPGISNLTMDQRSVISTMCAELGAEFAVFPFDSTLSEYLLSKGYARLKPVYPDNDTQYFKEYYFNMNEIEPMVALPDSVVGNVKPVTELPPTEIDQATIGSCANGKLSDIEIAARILNGRKVNSHVRLIVTPATQNIYQEAVRQGYVSIITEAGGIVTNPTCGSCFGGHMGLLASGEVGITSTTRNFKGRMGSRDAKIYMASSATVAASAVMGVITDPRAFLKERMI
ncbi:MAG: aconitase/3-isopropylmalate dehydratase large subunit family protein [Thermoplasmatales archaeon]